MFPQSRTDTESQFLYHIHLSSFPIVHDSDSLSETFKNIFIYMPEDTLFIWAQPTLLFSSPNMHHITLSIYLSLLGHTFTITDSAKRRTSQHARPVVLKLYALLIECNIVQENPPSIRHLLIEAFQPSSPQSLFMTLNWDSTFYRYAIFNISLSPALSLSGPHKNNLFVSNSCNVSQPLPYPNTSPRTDLPSASYPSLMAVEALLMLLQKLLVHGQMPFWLRKMMQVRVLSFLKSRDGL